MTELSSNENSFVFVYSRCLAATRVGWGRGWAGETEGRNRPRGIDFITIDGGEGGTAAGPLVFADHVALPFKVGFSRVRKILTEHRLHQRVCFIGFSKLGLPESAVFAFALGYDAIGAGREACAEPSLGFVRSALRRIT